MNLKDVFMAKALSGDSGGGSGGGGAANPLEMYPRATVGLKWGDMLSNTYTIAAGKDDTTALCYDKTSDERFADTSLQVQVILCDNPGIVGETHNNAKYGAHFRLKNHTDKDFVLTSEQTTVDVYLPFYSA